MNLHDTQRRIRNKYTMVLKKIGTARGSSKQQSITNRSLESVYSIILSIFKLLPFCGDFSNIFLKIFPITGFL